VQPPLPENNALVPGEALATVDIYLIAEVKWAYSTIRPPSACLGERFKIGCSAPRTERIVDPGAGPVTRANLQPKLVPAKWSFRSYSNAGRNGCKGPGMTARAQLRGALGSSLGLSHWL
jgi:hypothetical protein